MYVTEFWSIEGYGRTKPRPSVNPIRVKTLPCCYSRNRPIVSRPLWRSVVQSWYASGERGGFMRLVGAFLLHAVLASFIFAQANPSDSSQPSATIRSNPRLVLLNVVVTNSKGEPVHGLNQHDFSVFEDGKAQSIRSFEEHSHAAATDKQKPVPLRSISDPTFTPTGSRFPKIMSPTSSSLMF